MYTLGAKGQSLGGERRLSTSSRSIRAIPIVGGKHRYASLTFQVYGYLRKKKKGKRNQALADGVNHDSSIFKCRYCRRSRHTQPRQRMDRWQMFVSAPRIFGRRWRRCTVRQWRRNPSLARKLVLLVVRTMIPTARLPVLLHNRQRLPSDTPLDLRACAAHRRNCSVRHSFFIRTLLLRFLCLFLHFLYYFVC